MTELINPLLKETFVFRPANIPMEGIVVTSSRSNYTSPNMLRYADGNWIPDDGKPDLAFVEGVFAYGVWMPHHTNILWEWRDMDLSRPYIPDYLRYHTPSWHYHTMNNTHWRDHGWNEKERDNHPNEIAHRSAIQMCSEIHGCANGRPIYLTQPNEWIRQRLLLVKSTMQPVKEPDDPVCFLCLNDGVGHLIQALESKQSELEGNIEYAVQALNKAERDTDNYTDDKERYEEELDNINLKIKQLKGEGG